jgi:hypothetical protein
MTVYVLRYDYYEHLLGVYATEEEAEQAYTDWLDGVDPGDYSITPVVVGEKAELY